MKFCLRDLLGKRQQESLFKFLDAVSDLCSDEQPASNVDLEDNLNHACALMERDWPISLQVRLNFQKVDLALTRTNQACKNWNKRLAFVLALILIIM